MVFVSLSTENGIDLRHELDAERLDCAAPLVMIRDDWCTPLSRSCRSLQSFYLIA